MSYSRWSTAIGFDYATAYPGLEYPNRSSSSPCLRSRSETGC